MTVGKNADAAMQVCFRLTYYQGRAGLVGVDAVVGHSSASLGPPDKALKKAKAKTSKRKAATHKAGAPDQHAGAVHSSSCSCISAWCTASAAAVLACLSRCSLLM